MDLGAFELHVGPLVTRLQWNSTCDRWMSSGICPHDFSWHSATATLGFDPPEMYFVHNVVEIKNSENGLVFRFHAEDALKHVLSHDERPVKVAAAKHWRQSKS